MIGVIGAMALAPVPSLAQSSSPRAQEEAERLREIEERRADNARRAQALRDRTAAAEAALAALKARLVATADSLQTAERRATEVEDRLAELIAEETEVQADLAVRREEISSVLAALQSLERSRPPALAVSPDDANSAAIAAIALAAITPEIQAEAEALRAAFERLEGLRSDMVAERRALEEAETALSERSRLLEDLLAEREAAQAQDTAQLRRLAAEDARLAREADTLRDLLAGIERRTRGNETNAAELTAGGPEIYARLPDLFSAAQSLLPLPASGRISSRYGDRIDGGGRAEDVTLTTRPGAVVTAPFRGQIAWAEPFGRLGNVIIIDVGENYRLVLIGLGSLDVRRGEIVRAGEPLGTMSRDGPGLLRFQIRRQNVPVDPMPWLRQL